MRYSKFLSLLLCASAFGAESSKSPIIFGTSGGSPCAYNVITGACLSTGGSPASPAGAVQINNGSGGFGSSTLVSPDSGVSLYNTQFSEGYLENLFSNSGNIPAGPWIGMFGSQSNNQTDPNGFTKAVKYQFASRQVDCLLYGWSFPTGVPYNASAWIKGQSGGEQIYFGTIKDESGTTGSIDSLSGPITATTSFVRYNLNFSPTAAAAYFGFCEENGSGSDAATIFGPQLSGTLTTAGSYTPTSGLQPLKGNGISATFAQFDTVYINNVMPKLLLPLLGGVGCAYHNSAYWDTVDNNFQVCDNTGTSHQVGYVGGSSHGIDSVGQMTLSSGSTTLSDAAITSSSIITDSLVSANEPGVLQYSCTTGSCSVQSYNTGFSGTNFSDNSTYNYVVQH